MRFATADVGHYDLTPFPGCSQIIVSNHAFIEKEHRGHGLGTALAQERVANARDLGYDYMMATVRSDNAPQLAIMARLGWKELDRFVNRETEHELILFGLRLGGEA